MTDEEIIALAHKYIEFDQGKIDGATLNEGRTFAPATRASRASAQFVS